MKVIIINKKISKTLMAAVVLLISIFVTACGNDAKNSDTTVKEILDDANKALEDVTSADMNMNVNFSMTMATGSQSINMTTDMTSIIKTTSNPTMAYMETEVSSSNFGETSKYTEKEYIAQTGDSLITYNCMITDSEDTDDEDENTWYKSTSDVTTGQLDAQMSLVSELASYTDSLSLEGTEKINGTKSYKISGSVGGNILLDALSGIEEDTSSVLSIIDVEDLEKENIDVSVWFSVKTGLPTKITMDVADIITSILEAELAEAGDETYTYTVEQYDIEFLYNSFNDVGIIEIPSNIIENAVDEGTDEGTEDDEDYEEWKEYFSQIDLSSIGLDVNDMENWTDEDWQAAEELLYEEWGN